MFISHANHHQFTELNILAAFMKAENEDIKEVHFTKTLSESQLVKMIT